MTKLLRINNKLMLNSNSKLIGVVDYVPPANTRVNFTSGTCSLQTYTFNTSKYRVQFMVLPTDANATQFATCNNAIVTEQGYGIFWVTSYTIDASGNMHVEGYKGYNSTSTSRNSGWPTLGSNNTLYYYGGQTFGGVSAEAHKSGSAVPANAIAVMLAYRNWYDTSIQANTVLTDKAYNSVADSTTAFITDGTFVDTLWNLSADTTATYDITTSNIVYPWATNRTIVCGSKDSLTAL